MNIQETKEAIRIMQAYCDGKTIESKSRNTKDDWHEKSEIEWDWFYELYRIKPEPHYRPFESAEEVMEAIRERGDWVKYDGGYYRITYFSHDSVQVSDCSVESFMEAFKELTWDGGTPFGKLEE